MKNKITILFLLFSTLVLGQENIYNPELISENNLKKDLYILKDNLESIHPGLYTYTDKENLDSAFKNIENNINKPMNDIDFYRLLAPLQTKIKNGHTMIIPSEYWSSHKDDRIKLFPFEIYIDNGQIYVLKNLSNDESVLKGTEIKSINGEPIQDVISQLLNSITRDGDNTSYPTKLLQIGFEQWYADIIGTPAIFELELMNNNSKYFTKNIIALDLKKINENHLTRYKEVRVPWYLRENEKSLSLKIDKDIAILTVPTFDSSTKAANGKKYKKFYNDVFKQIKTQNIKKLILDLRNNGGGDPKPQLALLKHLIDKPLSLYKRTYAITRKIPNPKLFKDDKVGRLNFSAKLALKKRNGVYEETGNFFARLYGAPSKKPVAPSKNLYLGKLLILTNGGSFSATGEVAGLLKEFKRGIFVGEETGGSDYQNSSGIMLMLYLPYSQTRVRIPMLCYELNVNFKKDTFGVIPDFMIRNNIDDALNKKDSVKEYALNLINNLKKADH